MARLFISYHHADRPQALRLARAMEARGHLVWWDRELASGENFRSAIARELRNCDAAIVIWTESSVESAFVCDEADMANKYHKYLPVSFDPVLEMPLGFGQFSAVDLSNWQGGAGEAQMEALDQRTEAIISGAFSKALRQPNGAERQAGRYWDRLFTGAIIIRFVFGALLIALAVALMQAVLAISAGGTLQPYPINILWGTVSLILLRVARQPMAIRSGSARKFADDTFATDLSLSFLASLQFFALLLVTGQTTSLETIDNAPRVALILAGVLTVLRYFTTASSLVLRRL